MELDLTPCERCGQVHDPRRCKAHSRKNDRMQCRANPMLGQQVCAAHGGKTKAARAKGQQRYAEAKLTAEVGKLTFRPVDNPLLELQSLAGEARAWKELCAEHVSRLQQLRYASDTGDAVRGEVLLFERAMDRCSSILASIARLNIDERLVAIAESQRDMIVNAIDAALTKAGLTGPAIIAGRAEVARHLRVAVNAAPVAVPAAITAN